MKVQVPYKNLEHTLQSLKLQAIDSLPTIGDYIPDYILTPKQLFYYLKSVTTYKNDPKGIELLQMAQTLLEGGYWGIPGYGDCDCFTILALASLEYIGAKPTYVAIVGNTRRSPTHVYAEVFDEDKGKITAFDLTNPTYGMERPYKFKQRLPVKNMMLALADNGSQGVRTLYNRSTGQAIVVPLAGKVRKAKKAAKQARKIKVAVAKQEGKATVKTNRVKKKVARSTGQTTRITNRQESRTAGAQVRQGTRMVKLVGKQAVAKQNQQNNLIKAQQQGATSPEFEPEESDLIAPSSAEGSEWMTRQVPGYDQDDTIDTTYEEAPEEYDEEGEYAYPAGYEDEPGELSAPGIFGMVIDAAKGAIKGVTKGGVGKVVNKGVDVAKQYALVKAENTQLKNQIQSQKTNSILYAGGAFVVGAAVGYGVSKLSKR